MSYSPELGASQLIIVDCLLGIAVVGIAGFAIREWKKTLTAIKASRQAHRIRLDSERDLSLVKRGISTEQLNPNAISDSHARGDHRN